jgi:nitroreductase
MLMVDSPLDLITDFGSRLADTKVSRLFLERWSTRAFDPQVELPQEILDRALEAGRWTWSSSNLQPWRAVCGYRKDKTFVNICNHLQGFNQAWAPQASALIAVFADVIKPDGTPNTSALFDTGAFAFSLAMQLHIDGWFTHAMGGVEFEALMQVWSVDNKRFTPYCVIAVGKRLLEEQIPEYVLEREVLSTRKHVAEFAKKRFEF